MRHFAWVLLMLAVLVITLSYAGVESVANLLSIEAIQLKPYWSWMVALEPYLAGLLIMSGILVFRGRRAAHLSQRRRAISSLGRKPLATLGRRSPEV